MGQCCNGSTGPAESGRKGWHEGLPKPVRRSQTSPQYVTSTDSLGVKALIQTGRGLTRMMGLGRREADGIHPPQDRGLRVLGDVKHRRWAETFKTID